MFSITAVRACFCLSKHSVPFQASILDILQQYWQSDLLLVMKSMMRKQGCTVK